METTVGRAVMGGARHADGSNPMATTARTALLATLALLVSPLLVVVGTPPAHAAVSVFPVPTSDAGLGRIVTAPDGNMWFVEEDTNKIGRITPQGAITEFNLGETTTGEGRVIDIDAAPDGSIWVVYDSGWKAARLDPATGNANVTQLGAYPYGGAVRVGADNVAWVTLNYGDSGILRIVPGQPTVWTANAPECDDVLGEAISEVNTTHTDSCERLPVSDAALVPGVVGVGGVGGDEDALDRSRQARRPDVAARPQRQGQALRAP